MPEAHTVASQGYNANTVAVQSLYLAAMYLGHHWQAYAPKDLTQWLPV
jgi:hypothetical protein